MLLLHSSHSTNPNVTPTRLNADAPNVFGNQDASFQTNLDLFYLFPQNLPLFQKFFVLLQHNMT